MLEAGPRGCRGLWGWVEEVAGLGEVEEVAGLGLSQNEFHRITWMMLMFVKGLIVLSPSSGLHPGRVLSGPLLRPPFGSP